MDAKLSSIQIAILAAYAVAMACGQILFKAAALRVGPTGSLGERFTALAHNGYFAVSVVLYAALTVVWVWILTFTPLSRAYGFVALSFVVTPFLGAALFGEPISIRLVVGIGLIVGGLCCVAG